MLCSSGDAQTHTERVVYVQAVSSAAPIKPINQSHGYDLQQCVVAQSTTYIQGVLLNRVFGHNPCFSISSNKGKQRRSAGRRRSESPEFPPVPSGSRDLPAAAPVMEARRSGRSGSAATTREAARRLAPEPDQLSAASLQELVRRSTRRQDLTKDTFGKNVMPQR